MGAADITPAGGRPIIESYGRARFRVSGVAYADSILVLPMRTEPWPVASVSEITIASFAAVMAPGACVDILLLGCGARAAAIDPALKRSLKAAGIALDIMDTGAACRTYNVLAGENRRVAAALIALR